MNALLLIAHGSRRAASNDEVRTLADLVGRSASAEYPLVQPAFLELAEPDIVAGVARCREAGAHSITAVPYFLSAGRHVAEDVPAELAKAVVLYPELQIRLVDHVGMHRAMPELLLSAAGAGGRLIDQPAGE